MIRVGWALTVGLAAAVSMAVAAGPGWAQAAKSQAGSQAVPAAKVCPGAAWGRATPEAVGWSRAKLSAADALAKTMATDAFVVVVGGRVIWSYGAAEKPGNMHSVRKSIASVLFGILADKGKLDRKVTLASLGISDIGGLSAVEGGATVLQLMSARSCIYHPAAYETKSMIEGRPARGSCRPGERWHYNNWDFNALATIYQKLSGEPLFDAFQRELAGPLQFAHFQKSRDTEFRTEGKKSRHPAYLFRLSALDMARLGVLMARGGDWCGRRIVSRAWVDESTAPVSSTDRKTGYGYMWWTSDAGIQFRHRFNGRTFSARGARGQFILVNPAEDLVIAHRVDTDDRSRRVRGREKAALLKAIMAAKPGS